MTHDGFGAAMKMSQELNFAFLANELCRLSSEAIYDDRLLNGDVQIRLTSSGQDPETSLDHAAEILTLNLRRSHPGLSPATRSL